MRAKGPSPRYYRCSPLVDMEKFPKSRLAKILLSFLLLLLLLLTPFVSTSLRPSYLYLVLNILIVALGVEAGFLTAISGPRDEKKGPTIITPVAVQALPDYGSGSRADVAGLQEGRAQPVKPVEKPKVEKAVAVAKRVQKAVKRCPSKPSIFFIGGFDGEGGVKEEEDDEKAEEGQAVVVGELSKQELFAKAETFIGNFYKQLKMQREESWKKIHGLYHGAF